MPDTPTALSPEEVDALERKLCPNAESEIDRLFATVRDRERQLEKEASDHNTIQVQTEHTLHAVEAERGNLQRQLNAARKDTERLDYLESEWELERATIADHGHFSALFRRNQPITREAIDAELRRIAGAARRGVEERRGRNG